jgi:hypothetical protein
MTTHSEHARVLLNGAPVPETLPAWLRASAKGRGAAVAIRHKVRGVWRTRTWNRLATEVAHVANAFEARGFGKGDVVVVASDVRPEAVVVTLAAQSLGGAAIWGVSAGNEEHVRFAFATDEAELVAIRETLQLRAPFVLGLHASGHGRLRSPDTALLAYDQLVPATLTELVDTPLRAAPDEPALFFDERDLRTESLDVRASSPRLSPRIHPSTHEELIAAANVWLDAERIDDRHDAFASKHSAPAQIHALLAAWLVAGFRLNCPEHASTAHYDRRELRPTLVAATSDTYAEIHRSVMASLPPKGTVSRRVVDWGLAKEAGAWRSILGEWFVRRRLRDIVGFSRVKTALVLGSAPDDAVRDLFARLGTNLRGIGEPRSTAQRDLASIFEPPPDVATSRRGGAP